MSRHPHGFPSSFIKTRLRNICIPPSNLDPTTSSHTTTEPTKLKRLLFLFNRPNYPISNYPIALFSPFPLKFPQKRSLSFLLRSIAPFIRPAWLSTLANQSLKYYSSFEYKALYIYVCFSRILEDSDALILKEPSLFPVRTLLPPQDLCPTNSSTISNSLY